MSVRQSELILVGQVSAGLISLVAVTLTARYVGPEVFSFCSIATTIFIGFMSLTDFGSCSWAARELASEGMSEGEYISVMHAKLKLNLVPLFLSPIIFLLLPNRYSLLALLCVYPLLWNHYNFVQQFLVIKGLIRDSTLLVVIERFCWLLVIPFQLLGIDRTLSFVLPILTGLSVHALIGNRYFRAIDVEKSPATPFKQIEIFRSSRHFGFMSIFGAISNYDGAIVAVTSTIESSASYILSQRFRNPLMLIFNSFSIRIKPIAAKKNFKMIKGALKDDFHLLFLGIIGNLLVSILMLFGYSRFLGADYENIGIVMCMGTLTSIPMGITLVNSSILNGLGFEKNVSRLNGVFTFLILPGVSISAHFGGSVAAVGYVLVQSIIYASYLSVVTYRGLVTA
jgi:O-antigen/teichoic acid export membrane protein